MDKKYPSNVENEIKSCLEYNNAYVADRLKNFMHQQLDTINNLGRSLYLDENEIAYLQEQSLKEIKGLDLTTCYSKKNFKLGGYLGFEILDGELEKYIYKQKPILNDMNAFFSKHNLMQDKRDELINHVDKVKRIIKKYNSTNKKNLVVDCVNQLDSLATNIKRQTYHEAKATYQYQLNHILQQLQERENKYYDHLRFFSSCRKKNSSLQRYLNEASQVLLQMRV